MLFRKTLSIACVILGAATLSAPAFSKDPKETKASKVTLGPSDSKAPDTAPSASATAAPAPDPNNPAEVAKALYNEGVDLSIQKSYPQAEAKFLQAWALQKSYDVAANLGEVEMQLDKPAEAALYFTYALANFPASGKTEKRTWIEGRLKEARSKVAAVTVSVNVPGAEIRVNGKLAGKAPLEGELFLPPGDVTVEVAAPEYVPAAKKVKATAGGTTKVDIDLELPKKSIVPALAAGGVGLAGVVVGVALYIVSNQKYDEAKQLHDQIASDPSGNRYCVGVATPNAKCNDLKSAAQLSDALAPAGIGLIVGGAILTAAGGAYFGYTLRDSSPPKTGGGPKITAIGVRGTGLSLQGSF
jgi:tetratricopeptide (TPR) repeat protein